MHRSRPEKCDRRRWCTIRTRAGALYLSAPPALCRDACPAGFPQPDHLNKHRLHRQASISPAIAITSPKIYVRHLCPDNKVFPINMSETPNATTDTKHLVNLRGRPGALYQLLQMQQLLGGSVQVCAIRCIRYKVNLTSAADILLTCVSGPLLDWLKIGPNRQTMLVSCSS